MGSPCPCRGCTAAYKAGRQEAADAYVALSAVEQADVELVERVLRDAKPK